LALCGALRSAMRCAGGLEAALGIVKP